MTSRLLALVVLTGLAFPNLLALPASADPGSLALQAQLIWGTDAAKPSDKSLKPIPADLDKRLRRIFKWQNYFEVFQTNFVVAATKPVSVDMSRDCRIEVSEQSGGDYEIQLFGKGRLVVRKLQRILPGETIVLAGDDKDYNAWFVILTPRKPRTGAP